MSSCLLGSLILHTNTIGLLIFGVGCVLRKHTIDLFKELHPIPLEECLAAMEIKHKDNTIYLVFKDEYEAEMYYAMHGELWEKIGVHLQPCCAGGYMNAYSLEKLGKSDTFNNTYDL